MLKDEHLVPLSEAAQFCPRRRGKPRHPQTLARWARLGCRGVKLEVMETPSGPVTSQDAVVRFFEELSRL